MSKRSKAQKSIDDELAEFKSRLSDGHELATPWDGLALDQFDESEGEDWDRNTKRLFEKSGLDPKRIGHWRLLTGVLANGHCDGYEENERSADGDINDLGFWVRVRDQLIDEACRIAESIPKSARSDERIAKKLRERPFLLHSKPNKKGELRRSVDTVRKRMKQAMLILKRQYDRGEFDGQPERKASIAKQIGLFNYHQD